MLPGDGWAQRVAEGRGLQGFEGFLALVRQQVLARAALADAGYGLAGRGSPAGRRVWSISPCRWRKGSTASPRHCKRLAAVLRRRLEDPDDPPEPGLRQRLDATIRGLERRADQQLAAWGRLLRDIAEPSQPETVEWFSLDRIDGLETDVAVTRSWVDPGIPFAEQVARPAHGLVVTSATLTDGAPDPELAWRGAEAATGLRHLPERPAAARIASPFDYPVADPGVCRHRHPARRHRPGRRRLCRAVRRRRRWGARPLHRDRPAARGASAHRLGARSARLPAAGPACRGDVDSDPGRHLSRRGGFLPARHRCDPRRRRRPRPLAASDRVRPRALAAPGHSAPRPPAGFRRRALFRPDRPAAAAPGLWPAGPPR